MSGGADMRAAVRREVTGEGGDQGGGVERDLRIVEGV